MQKKKTISQSRFAEDKGWSGWIAVTSLLISCGLIIILAIFSVAKNVLVKVMVSNC